jgi:hypothetical protein
LFGESAATRRRLLADRQMQATIELINRATSQEELIRLAEEIPQ